jgi:hypothetical protein
MPDRHEFLPQPHSASPGCSRPDPDRPGRAASAARHRDHTGQAGDPDDDAIKTHRLITRLPADLTRHYRQLSGVDLDANTALDLAGIDRSARPGGLRL